MKIQNRPQAKMIGLSIFIARSRVPYLPWAQLDSITARVERVIDGDTVRVRFDGKSHTVRLMGVDTPEAKRPTQAAEYFGRDARAFTRAASLKVRRCGSEKDTTGDTRDRYGRLLRHVYLDRENFNARLIREGYAHACRRFAFSKRQEFIDLEEQARRRGLGLWGRR